MIRDEKRVEQGMDCDSCGSTDTKLLIQKVGCIFAVKVCFECRESYQFDGSKWINLAYNKD